MRYPAEHKRQSSQRILREAGRLFRKQGYAATGVDAVMKSADLTAGAFYAHFRSKEELLAATLDAVFCNAGNDRPEPLNTLHGRDWVRAFVSFYVSAEHRDAVEKGCPMPALAADVARIGGQPREVFEHHLRRVLDNIAGHFDAQSPDRERAIATMSLCLGGLMLARAVNDGELSAEILHACRNTVIEQIVPGRQDDAVEQRPTSNN
ncbi:MAG TPA: TetR/AcrR family transcriptional regulator [Candidatus Eisenbacteria bacterium]|nr:TetR/AcrR family transcriptional regulator [Candidatus Eisenbacteria bacterium]